MNRPTPARCPGGFALGVGMNLGPDTVFHKVENNSEWHTISELMKKKRIEFYDNRTNRHKMGRRQSA